MEFQVPPGRFVNRFLKFGPIISFTSPAAGQVSTVNLAPGSLVSIFGANLAARVEQGTSLPLPMVLGGTTVSANGRPIGLLYAGPNQINAYLPDYVRHIIFSLHLVLLVFFPIRGVTGYVRHIIIALSAWNRRLFRWFLMVFTHVGAGIRAVLRVARGLLFDCYLWHLNISFLARSNRREVCRQPEILVDSRKFVIPQGFCGPKTGWWRAEHTVRTMCSTLPQEMYMGELSNAR